MGQFFARLLVVHVFSRVLTSSLAGGRCFSIHPSDMLTSTCRWTSHPFFPQTTTRSWSSGFVQRLIVHR